MCFISCAEHKKALAKKEAKFLLTKLIAALQIQFNAAVYFMLRQKFYAFQIIANLSNFLL